MLDCSLSFCKISGSSQRDKIAAAAATDGTVVAAWVAIIMMLLLLAVVFILSCRIIIYGYALSEMQTLFFQMIDV